MSRILLDHRFATNVLLTSVDDICQISFQVSKPVLTQILYHEIGKVNTGIVPHRMPARESFLTPLETDPGS